LCRAPFWGLLAIFALLNANALLFINNVSFIDTALGQTSATAKVTLLWPVASAVSRVAAGGLSDRFERRISRTGFLFLAATTMTGVNAFLVFELQSVEVGAVIVGCCFGATWCLTPLIVDDEFGSASFGQTWSTLMVASAIGGFMLAPIEDAAYREHTAPGARECYGVACYHAAFEAKRGPGRGRLVALPVPGPRLGEGGPDNIVAGGAVCLTVSLDIVSLVCREPPRARGALFLPSWVAVGDSEH